MAFAEVPEIAAEAGAGGGEAGAGEGMTPDFNDLPVKKITSAIGGMIGTGGGDKERANIGPIGSMI
jgi:hypothetical protein